MRKFLIRAFYFAGGVILIVAVAWFAKDSILRAVGNYLIYEDPIEKVPALFVLSGDPWDRGNEAVRLYKAGYADKIICTGKNVPTLFKIADIPYPESELTELHIISQGVPTTDVELLCLGTSTKEECDFILEYCKKNEITKLAIVSSKFHTRRIKRTFKRMFDEAGLTVIIRGAPSSVYDEQRWWEKEEGLIFVNNEYIKLGYYWWKGFAD